MVSSVPGRSNHPAGLSQLGYACFWPKGGGLKEGFIHAHHDPLVEPSPHHHDDNETLEHTGAVEGVAAHQHRHAHLSQEDDADASS